MDDLLHRWLLVYLYHLATWLRHYAERLQVTIRHTLLLHASRSYNPKEPKAKKPKIPWQQLKAEAEKAGKTISPVKHRVEMPSTLSCPNCGAPSEYLYNFGYEHGHTGLEAFHKIRCILCGFQTAPTRQKRSPHFFCPYCGHALVKVKERSDFEVFKCKNSKCPYRQKKALRTEAQKFGANPDAEAYIYRSFKMELSELQLTRPEKPKVDFARLRHSTTAVALALTFHLHLGLSLRETAFWLQKLFLLPLSHQTVALWCQSVAYLVAPLLEQRVEEAEILVGDETIISVSGEEVYWWISYNPETATLVTQLISTERDTRAAAKLLKQTAEQAPYLTYFVSDAWDAYALAILYLRQQQSDTPQHIVVKGLQYRGVPEDAFLWYKELIERFFRTFKQRYRRTLGFASINGAVAFCVLFAVYYNFFRPHARADGKPPVQQFKENNVLRNWQQLVEIAIKQAA